MDHVQYAGRLERFLAALIDGIILGLFGWVINFVLVHNPGTNNNIYGTSYYIQLLIWILYFVLYQGLMKQTIGKKLMKIRVVDSSGKTPSFGRLILREPIGKFCSALILYIGYIMILWDKKRQGLHDKIADTYVVKVNGSGRTPPSPV